MGVKTGKQTVLFTNPPSVRMWASIGSKKEGEGPIAKQFDILEPDSTFGQDSWEKAESAMISTVLRKLLEKAALSPADIDCIFAGDLINQCTSTTYALREYHMPTFGIYGACSTMTEGAALASLLVESGSVTRAVALTSSHFCTAERQFRYPLEYGGVRTPTSQWTATAAGAIVVENTLVAPFIKGVTIGTIEDKGVCDQNNMGAAMAPAAAETLLAFFSDTGKKPADFDLIITGDLGYVGSALLCQLMSEMGTDIQKQHTDCGILIYDREKQDVHAGGSGCGCSAAVLCAVMLPALKEGRLKNILFLSTGALLSPTTVMQKESIPSIAHLIWLSSER